MWFPTSKSLSKKPTGRNCKQDGANNHTPLIGCVNKARTAHFIWFAQSRLKYGKSNEAQFDFIYKVAENQSFNLNWFTVLPEHNHYQPAKRTDRKY